MNIQSGQKKKKGEKIRLFSGQKKWRNANRPRKAEREMEDEKKKKMAIRTEEEEEEARWLVQSVRLVPV